MRDVLETAALIAAAILAVVFGPLVSVRAVIWWQRSEASMKRRFVGGVVVAMVLAVLLVKLAGQVIDCTYFPPWVWPCCCLLTAGDPTTVDWEIQQTFNPAF